MRSLERHGSGKIEFGNIENEQIQDRKFKPTACHEDCVEESEIEWVHPGEQIIEVEGEQEQGADWHDAQN